MSQKVVVEYVLIDRLSSKAAKMQKAVSKLEASLENIDKQTKNLGKSRDFEKWATRTSSSVDKVNKKLETSDKHFKTLGRNLDNTVKRQERLAKALDATNGHLAAQNKELGKLATGHKDAAAQTQKHAAAQRGLTTATEAASKRITNQTGILGNLVTAGSKLSPILDELILKENKLGDAMARKNIHAREQAGHLRDVEKATDRAARSQRRYNKELNIWGKTKQRVSKIQNSDDNGLIGAFLGGIDMGANQYDLLKKIVALLPVVGVGFGGIASMTAGASAGMLGLAGSITKVSGALALLPGAYAAAGIAVASFRGVQANILKPIFDSKDQLKSLDQQISDAQRSLTQAKERNALSNTPASAASSTAAMEDAEANLTELTKERAEIAKTIPKNAQKLLDKTEKIKDAWRAAWFGDGNKRADQVIDSVTSAMDRGIKLIEKYDKFFQRAVDAFTDMVDLADSLSRNPIFMGAMESAIMKSFDNATRLLKVLKNLAPVTAVILENSTQVTGEVLDQLIGWSKTYTTLEKIEDIQRRSLKWMREGAEQAEKWGKGIGSVLKGLKDLGGPATAEFDKRFFGKKGLFTRFEEWSARMSDSGKAATFSENSFKVLDGLGRVLLSIAGVVGKIGSDPVAANATVNFLDQLARGIESFGGFALNAMKEVGPEITKFFKAFGEAHKGSGDMIIEFIDKLVIGLTYLTQIIGKFTPDELIAVLAGLSATLTVIGGMIGTFAVATKGVKTVTNLLGITKKAPMPVVVMNPGQLGRQAASAGATGGALGRLGAIVSSVLGLAVVGAAVAMLVGTLTAVGVDKLSKWATGRENKDYKSDLKFAEGLKDPEERKKAMVDIAKNYSPVEVMGHTVYDGKPISRKGYDSDTDWAKKNKKMMEGMSDAQTDTLLKEKGGLSPDKFDKFLESEAGFKYLDNLMNKRLPESVKTGMAKGAKAAEKGGKQLGAANDRAGQDAWAPLNKWQRMVQASLTAMGVPASVATGGTTTSSGNTAATGSSSSFYSPAPRTGDSNRPVAGGGGPTAGLSSAMGPAISMANRLGGTITSGLRPGAITSSGHPSDHSTGNAIDVGGSPALMSKIAMAANALPGVKQVIYSPVGWSRNGGPFSPVTDAAVKADHYDHVHIAMGGSGKGGAMPGMGGIPGLPGFPGTVMGQAVGSMAQNAYNYLSQQMGMGGDPTSMGAAGGSMQQIIQSAASAYGASYPGLLAVAQAESSLNPNAANNWDINAQNGTPSKGLFQFIEPTYGSMSAQAMAANPSAWAGVNSSWMDPMAQALTAAWAFTHGQGSHWATQSHYGTGDGIGGGSAGFKTNAAPRPKVRKMKPRRTGGAAPRAVSGGANVFHTTVVVQGALFLDEKGREKLGDMVGQHVAKHVVRASSNVNHNEDI